MLDSGPPPWESGAYSVKRHGVTLTHCDAEPIQTPGCIQGCGALLVLRAPELVVLQVSENCEAWVGSPPERLLGRSCLEIFGEEAASQLRSALGHEALDRNPIYAFTLPAGAGGVARALDLTVHTVDGLVLLELEPAGSLAGPDTYAMVSRAAMRLQAATTLRSFCDAAAEEVRKMTGFSRVMIYRFHPDHHGEVVAERRREDLPSWLGLHYPPEDIPRPAREIFQKIWVRPLPDARGALHEMVPLINPDTGRALEMTHCVLRGASVMYSEYLQNMGVAASLTMPIRVQGALWGLIACHHDQALPAIPWPMRVACELLAQIVSLQLRVAEDREHFAYRLQIDSIHQQLVARAAQVGELRAMLEGTPGLLDGLSAQGAALYHQNRWLRAGEAPEEAQLDALASWLETRPELTSSSQPLFVTDSLSREWPEGGAALTAVASGVLAFRLGHAGRSLILWFRPETARELRWAGNPQDKPSAPGPHGPRLTPRVSFELFLESVRGRAQPWSLVEIEAALRLRVLVLDLVVSRAEQLGALNTALERSNDELDAFAYVASHDLKEPLRGIHRYAHLLLADATALDEENRKRLDGLMRLTLRMDSLLDSLLHFSRVGRVELELEEVDLDELLGEAIEMVGARSADTQREIQVPRPLGLVRGDRVRLREVLTNLLSNALKYNDGPVRRIEVGTLGPDEPGERPGLPEEARGATIYFVKDNGIGIDRPHFARVWSMFKRLHGRDVYGGGTGAGLTIVKKLVERHGGQVWLDSTLGVGTTFFFTLRAPATMKGGASA